MQKKVYILGAVIALLVAVIVAGVLAFVHYREQAAPVKEEAVVEAVPDSISLNIVCLPTLESLPFYYARESGIAKRMGLPLTIRTECSQITVDSLFRTDSLCHAAVLDTYRMAHATAEKKPFAAEVINPLVGRWGLATSSNLRIREMAQMKKRIVAAARYATSSHCLEKSLSGGGVTMAAVYHAQINDYELRLRMLDNAQVDASLLPEPFFSLALQKGHKNLWVGDSITTQSFCLRTNFGKEEREYRKKQIELLKKAYNEAVAQINSGGAKVVKTTLVKCYALPPESADKLLLPHYREVE